MISILTSGILSNLPHHESNLHLILIEYILDFRISLLANIRFRSIFLRTTHDRADFGDHIHTLLFS